MRQARVKPEAFRYFHNSKTYYLVATVTEPVVNENVITILKGTIIQIVFDSQTLGSINLPDSKELLVTVEDIAHEVFVRGRRVLRFSCTRINEEDQWGSD